MDTDFWQQIQDKPVSGPCAHFLRGVHETLGFVFFVVQVVANVDEMRLIAAKALAEVAEPDEAEKHQESLEDAEKKEVTATLRKYNQVIFQVLITRFVDHYLAFISGLLSEIFREHPETLRSGEQVRLDFVLRHESMDELVNGLAERRVDRLAYQGLRELATNLNESLGFVLFEKEDDLRRAERIIEDRNLIVHNQAVVNPKYLRKVPDNQKKLGKKLEFEFDTVFEDIDFLSACAVRTDDLAREKWRLVQTQARLGS